MQVFFKNIVFNIIYSYFCYGEIYPNSLHIILNQLTIQNSLHSWE